MGLAAKQVQFKFDGSNCDDQSDGRRLTGQIQRIYALMRDGKYRTLDEIAADTGAPAASVSAQLRNLRKDRFGGHTVEKRVRGARWAGIWEYRLVANRDG